MYAAGSKAKQRGHYTSEGLARSEKIYEAVGHALLVVCSVLVLRVL